MTHMKSNTKTTSANLRVESAPGVAGHWLLLLIVAIASMPTQVTLDWVRTAAEGFIHKWLNSIPGI